MCLFKIQYNIFKNKLKTEGAFIIDGGRNGYNIFEVSDEATTIKQGKTLQVHQKNQLESLFCKGYFYGPRNRRRYTRSDKDGHLGMKNAIVDFLIKL